MGSQAPWRSVADEIEHQAACIDQMAAALRGLADIAQAPGHLHARAEVNRADFAALLQVLSRGAAQPVAALDAAAAALAGGAGH